MIMKGCEHVHDVLNLFTPITNAELSLFQFLCHFLLFVRVLCCNVLHVLHQPLNVSKAKEFGNERLGRELVEIMEMFTDTKEDDRSLRRSYPKSVLSKGTDET